MRILLGPGFQDQQRSCYYDHAYGSLEFALTPPRGHIHTHTHTVVHGHEGMAEIVRDVLPSSLPRAQSCSRASSFSEVNEHIVRVLTDALT